MTTTKATFRQIAERNIGRVLFHHYTKRDGSKHTLAFMPIPPRASNMRCCDCGLSQWNATNFSGDIHFCPHTELDIEFTDYKAIKA